MGILEKMISDGGRILDIIKPTIEYDILTTSSTALRVKTEIITEGPDNNLVIIFEDRALNSELSDVLEDFESITVNNNDNIKELQSKKRKRNKYYCTENITHGF